MSSPYTLVAGLGKTGQSVARYLERRQQPYVLCDTREFLPEKLSEVQCIISSPGVPLDVPLFKQARALGIPIMGDIECLAREITAPVVAITGSNGKSTVTSLVGEMAKAAGINVAVAGNIGTPVLDSLENRVPPSLWVLELSSFQLDLTESLAPAAATVLNISPDHLDRHHNMQAYIDAKQRIYRNAKLQLFNRNDQQTQPLNQVNQSIVKSFGLDDPGQQGFGMRQVNQKWHLVCDDQLLLCVDDMGIKGQHNWENALAACALSQAVGIPSPVWISVLKQFSGLEHRSQWVRTINNVDYINDSKGTNIGATLSAITGIGPTLSGKIVLIAGGLGKGADFNALKPAISKYVQSLILLGTDAPLIAETMKEIVPISFVQNMDEAVKSARKQAQKGDVVLLSPACASLDMFRDYTHRGEVFMAAVNEL
jgi:UDP-N-acetylmuramoylalanine--D-glutamate ligase